MAETSLLALRKQRTAGAQIVQQSGAQFLRLNAWYNPPPNSIRGVAKPGGAWWTAGQPIVPIAPAGTSPRGWQFLSEQNKIYTPRATEYLTFDDLRAYSCYPLARILIEAHKDMAAAKKWKVRLRQVPGQREADRSQAELKDNRLRKLTDFFMNPSPDTTWREFVSQWIEEVLVTDAPALYLRRNTRRDVAEIRIIDGAMIARYVDDNGWTPTNESPAYAQLWWGTPAWDLRRDQLLYRPRWPRVYKLYGFSATEKIARLIELGMARLELRLQWAENGTIPDGLMVVPRDAPVQLIERQQGWMNSVMGGNLQKRVQLRLIQGFTQDGKDQLIFPKEKILTDEYDDFEIREFCFNYGVPKQRLLQEMNRSTAEQAQEAAEEEGIGPTLQYIMDSMNLLIQSPLYFGLPMYEFVYEEDREHDIVAQSQADVNYLKVGAKTLDEVRDGLGLDAYGNTMSKVPLAYAQPVYPMLDSAALAKPAPKGPGEGGEPEGNEPPPAAQPGGKQRKARRTTIADFEEMNRDTVTRFIGAARLDQKFEKNMPGMTINPHHFSLQGETARSNLQRTVGTYLRDVARKIVAKAGPQKANDKDDIRKLLGDDEFWSTLWVGLPSDIAPDLATAIRAGIGKGIIEASLSASSADVINEYNAIAKADADARAAEMVGMKYVDGKLVPNPNAQFVISDTTRKELQGIISRAFEKNTPLSTVIDDIQGAGAFSLVRAQMIAATEVSRAQAGGTYTVWEKTGVVQTCAWQHSNLPNVCQSCLDNAAQGEVPFGKRFQSGDLYPPAHPRCRCVIVARKTIVPSA